MSEPLLRFHRAALGYGRREVLSGVELSIAPGSFVGILGQNGSGKTTLLRTVLGLIPCLRGELVWRGGDPRGIRFGYVPQKEKLDPVYPLTGYDVAAMGTYRRLEPFTRSRGRGARTVIERALSSCGASALAKKRYSDLSGGQRQRVLIARALAAEPEVLALDEPMSGIDVTTQKSLIALLAELKRERGLTVLMVSHRVHAERELFSDIVWCEDGRAVMGPAEKMLADPKLREMFRWES